jgi:hypothetical protein
MRQSCFLLMVAFFDSSFLRAECDALVDEYAPQIAQKIFQGYPASVVCKDVGLCSSKKVDVAAKATGGIGCTICTLIVGYAGRRLWLFLFVPFGLSFLSLRGQARDQRNFGPD